VETIPELIRLLAEAPPEERVLPNPMELLQSSRFRLQTSRASSAVVQPVSQASVAKREAAAVGAAVPAVRNQAKTATASASAPPQSATDPAAPVSRNEFTKPGAAARLSEASMVAPAVPTSTIPQTVGPAHVLRYDWYSEPPAEVQAQEAVSTPFATPAERLSALQESAEFARQNHIAGRAAAVDLSRSYVGATARVVSPEYAAGVLAMPQIPSQQQGDAAKPNVPYYTSGVQVTPTTRVDFAIPRAAPFNAAELFSAADRLTAERAPSDPRGLPIRDLTQPLPQAGVESTAETAARHYARHQSTEFDRRY